MAAQRRGWRYFATRLNGDGTETLLDPDLPLENVGIEDVLSGHNSLTTEISPAYGRLMADADGLPLLREWGTAIYAENDGDIRAGGILVSAEEDGPTLNLDCVGFTGYLQDLPYTGKGYKGIKVDPIDVARVIWNYAQAQHGGNIGLTYDTTTTGGKISIGTELKQVEFDTVEGPLSFESGPYKLNYYSNHDLAANIDELAAFTPFDYHEKHSWKADETIRHHVTIGYPKIGRKRNDLTFVLGVNVFEPPTIIRDGAEYASGTMVLGAGDGPTLIKEISEPPTRPQGRLRRIAIVIDDTIKTKARALSRAQAENQWRARMDDISGVVVHDHPNARLGAVSVGDEIRLEGRGEWKTYDMWVRVLAISYSPEQGGVAEYSVARTDKMVA